MIKVDSKTSKMPCLSCNHYKCNTGFKLRKNKRSVCFGCYGHKSFYAMPRNKALLIGKTAYIENDLSGYRDQLYNAITENKRFDTGYFRYHDTGDILDIDHLKAIIDICKKTPSIKYWLPTKEYKIIREYIKQGNIIPDNLTIRLSAYLLDKTPKRLDKILNALPIATVYKDHNKATGYICKTDIKGNCGKCRICWDKTVKNVTYLYH